MKETLTAKVIIYDEAHGDVSDRGPNQGERHGRLGIPCLLPHVDNAFEGYGSHLSKAMANARGQLGVRLTNEQVDVGQSPKVGRDKVILPSGRHIGLHKYVDAVPGGHDPENHKDNNDHGEIEETGQYLEPRDEPEGVHVDDSTEHQHRYHYKSSVPATSHVFWVGKLNDTLQDDRVSVQAAREQSHITGPSRPALHPRQEPFEAQRSEIPRPIVLGARDGLDRGHLTEGGRLTEHTGRNNKIADYPSGRATVRKGEIHVPASGVSHLETLQLGVGTRGREGAQLRRGEDTLGI